MLSLFLINRYKILIAGLFLAVGAFAVKKGLEVKYAHDVKKSRAVATDCLEKPLPEIENCLRKEKLLQ